MFRVQIGGETIIVRINKTKIEKVKYNKTHIVERLWDVADTEITFEKFCRKSL